MSPAVCIVGRSGAGKTTLIEGLLPELAGRGYAVATVKHTHHRVEVDRPGSDTDRHLRAGACSAWLSGPGGALRLERAASELGYRECLARAGWGVDLVLVEGFKGADLPRIEVVRSVVSSQPMLAPEQLWLAATDLPLEGVECLSPDDYPGIADRIEKTLLQSEWRLEVQGLRSGWRLEVEGCRLAPRERRALRRLLSAAPSSEIRIRLIPGPEASEPAAAEGIPGPARRRPGESAP